MARQKGRETLQQLQRMVVENGAFRFGYTLADLTVNHTEKRQNIIGDCLAAIFGVASVQNPTISTVSSE